MKKQIISVLIFSILIIILMVNLRSRKRRKQSNKQKKHRKSNKKNESLEFFSSNNHNSLFQNMMNNHYSLMFPNNANRNAAGFRFFKYIYDNLATTNELFDTYNTFYCAVSGSIVSPDRPDNFSVLKVKRLGSNKCVIGKYYRCCVPCNCDIMKYTRIVETNLEIPRGSGKFYKKNLITIGDPCINKSKFPSQIDKNVFKCKGNNLELGYRVTNKGELTSDKGRLVVGVLYPIKNNEKKLLDESINGCLTGTKRFLSNENSLQYGMGDIFVKLALMNDNDNYTHTEQDFCTN